MHVTEHEQLCRGSANSLDSTERGWSWGAQTWVNQINLLTPPRMSHLSSPPPPPCSATSCLQHNPGYEPTTSLPSNPPPIPSSHHQNSQLLPELPPLRPSFLPSRWNLTSQSVTSQQNHCLVSPWPLVRTLLHNLLLPRRHHPLVLQSLDWLPIKQNHFKALYHRAPSYLTELVQPHTPSHALWCLPLCPFTWLDRASLVATPPHPKLSAL